MWTGFNLVSRLGGKSVLTPYDIFALRLITASFVLLPFATGMPPGAWRDGRLWILAILGNLLYCLLVYQGFRYAPAAHGAILLAGLQPFLISALVWLIAGTRPSRMRNAGLILIAFGIVCAAMPYFTDWSADSFYGDVLILLSSISWAFLQRTCCALGVFRMDADPCRGARLDRALSAGLPALATQATGGCTTLDDNHSELVSRHHCFNSGHAGLPEGRFDPWHGARCRLSGIGTHRDRSACRTIA